ncbi:MAG: translocase [Myxococcota bacterium]
MLALDVFLVLLAYYLIKVVREPLILVGGGAELKSYASAGQAVLLIGVVKIVDVMARRYSRLRLMASSWLFFAANLVAFYFLAVAEVPIGFVFFLWVGIFSVVVLAQFWSFANDVYTQEQGKRLFAIVGIGASAGAVAGSAIADLLIDSGGSDGPPDGSVYRLMLYAAGVLLVALTLTAFADRRAAARPLTSDAPPPPPEVIGGDTALTLIRRDRFLWLIALLILLLNWVNSTGEFVLGRLVETAAHDASLVAWEAARGAAQVAESAYRSEFERAFVGDFYAGFFKWVSILGVVIQLFVVSRVLKYVGVPIALMVLPTIALLGYGTLLVLPVLAVVRVAKTAENAIDYSLQNTTQQALFLVTSRAAKYKAKGFIDTVMRRLGDVLQAGVVWVGTALAFTTSHFAMVAMGLVAVWLVVALAIGREFKRRERATIPEA